MTVSLFFQLLANGLVTGGTYALVASGLTLTLGVIKLFNFAQGHFYMLGAWITYGIVVLLGLPYPVALLAALIAMALLGVLMYFGIIHKTLSKGFFAGLLVTVYAATIIQQTALLTFASIQKTVPPVFPGTLNIGDVTMNWGKLFAILCGIVVLVALYFFMKLKIGKAMIAAAENVDVAALQGINVRRIFWMTMAVGCGLSGLTGAIIAPVSGAYLTMGSDIFMRVLLVLMVGGMGSMSGALIGGFLVGIVESFAFQYVGYLNMVVIMACVAVFMFFRPGGLLGKPMPIPGE